MIGAAETYILDDRVVLLIFVLLVAVVAIIVRFSDRK